MRKLTLLLILLVASSLSLLIPVGCDKLTTETNNNTYYDSTLGQDCLRCHSDSDNKIAQPHGQWANSAHASPGLIETPITFNGQDFQTNVCGPQCHTSEGFIRYASNGTTATIQEPSVISCYTCHMPHTGNYGSWKVDTLRGLVSPVTLTGTNITYDAGKSNQCVVCHQATHIPTIPAGTMAISLDSLGADGPHYSTQAHDFIGQGGFRFGTTAITNTHTQLINNTQHGCLACHFGNGQGYSYAEHTFRLQSSDGSQQYLGNCTGCHSGMTNFYEGLKGKAKYVQAALDTLAGILISGHLLTGTDRDSTEYKRDTVVAADAARILFNYLFVKKDGSGGVHNSIYDSTLLSESIRQWESIPHARFSVSVDTGCAPLTVQFTDSSTGDIKKRVWHFAANDSSTEVNPAFTFTIPGTYNVTLDISSNGGASSYNRIITVDDSTTPVLTKPADTLKPDTVYTFSINHAFGGTTSWNFGDSTPVVQLDSSATHSYHPTVSQWFIITVERQLACGVVVITDSVYVTAPAAAAKESRYTIRRR